MSSDSFTKAEAALNISLPSSLKNVLKLNGFTDPQVIANISEDDLLQMELFMAETAQHLISQEEYEQYYGIFYRKPESFKFVQGYRKLIMLTSSYFQQKFSTKIQIIRPDIECAVSIQPSSQPNADSTGASVEDSINNTTNTNTGKLRDILNTREVNQGSNEYENQAECDSIDDSIVIVTDSDNQDIMSLLPIDPQDEEGQEEPHDLYKDVSDISSLGVGEDLLMEDSSSKFPQSEDVVEMGPFVKVTMGAKSAVIKKSSLCWLLEESKTKVSTDRLLRFITTSKSLDSRKRKSTQKTTSNTDTWRKGKIRGRISTEAGHRISCETKRNIRKKKCDGEKVSESSSDEQMSIRYDDSIDTESFSDTPDDLEARADDKIMQRSCNEINEDLDEKMDEQLTIIHNKFYAVDYAQTWYIGRINSEKLFVRPKKPDITNVDKEYVFFGPVEFISEEPFTLDDLQYEKICKT